MKKSKRFSSLSVISLEEGQQIGTVKGLIVDPASKKVAALIIEQKGWFKEQRFIPYHKVHSVGNDAITIEKNTCVEKASNLSEIIKLLKDRVAVIGSKIVAENGTVLGYVDEFYIDLETGAIAGLEFSGNLINSVIKGRAFLDIAYVRTLGKEVTIITDEGVENIFKLDGGLQETVKNIRESTGQFWGTTVQKTKELSTSINNRVKRDKKNDPQHDDLTRDIHEDLTESQNKSAAPEENSIKDQPLDEKDQIDPAKEALEETVISPSEDDNSSKNAPPPA